MDLQNLSKINLQKLLYAAVKCEKCGCFTKITNGGTVICGECGHVNEITENIGHYVLRFKKDSKLVSML